MHELEAFLPSSGAIDEVDKAWRYLDITFRARVVNLIRNQDFQERLCIGICVDLIVGS